MPWGNTAPPPIAPKVWTVVAFLDGAMALLKDSEDEEQVIYTEDLVPLDAVERLAEVGQQFIATEKDIGRGVVYTPYEGAPSEDGIITSVNERYVFVRYRHDIHSKATDPKDLRWLAP
jgi:hypothetical protein